MSFINKFFYALSFVAVLIIIAAAVRWGDTFRYTKYTEAERELEGCYADGRGISLAISNGALSIDSAA